MTTVTSRREAHDLQASVSEGTVVVASAGTGPFEQVLLDGRHALKADEPAAAGGGDAGSGPYELLLRSLGACSSMTVHMYAALPIIEAREVRAWRHLLGVIHGPAQARLRQWWAHQGSNLGPAD